MKNLIWIASYPKSGNTWLRLFVSSLMYQNDAATLDELTQATLQCSNPLIFTITRKAAPDFSVSPHAFQDREKLQTEFSDLVARKAPRKRITIKTHSYAGSVGGKFQISKDATAAAILAIRNPFDVCASVAKHYGLSLDEAIDFMNNEKVVLVKKDVALPMFMSSWRYNILSWLVRSSDLQVHRVRYEDMVVKPITVFEHLGRAVFGIKDERLILSALKNTRFNKLQDLESKAGFREAIPTSGAFFANSGIGHGFAKFSREQREKIYRPNEDLSRALGYQYDDDRLRITGIDGPGLRELVAKSSKNDARMPVPSQFEHTV